MPDLRLDGPDALNAELLGGSFTLTQLTIISIGKLGRVHTAVPQYSLPIHVHAARHLKINTVYTYHWFTSFHSWFCYILHVFAVQQWSAAMCTTLLQLQIHD